MLAGYIQMLSVEDGRESSLMLGRHLYQCGSQELAREKLAVINLWAEFLYEPLIEDRVRRIQETNDPQFCREVA